MAPRILKLGTSWSDEINTCNTHWAMGWTIGVLGFDSRRGLGIFFFTTASRTALEPTQPPIQWEPGAFPGIKRPGREADHSPPSNAEVKNAWSYTSTPQYVFMTWCLVKHRDNFTFYIYLWRLISCNILTRKPCGKRLLHIGVNRTIILKWILNRM
jgi:hypothetical protein